MNQRPIFILEDSDERIDAFKKAVAALGPDYSLRLWYNAPTMIAECAAQVPDACLISLDYQLMRRSQSASDPGNGLQVAEFLCNQRPACPVIVHTSAYERRWSMYNALSLAKWNVHVVAPAGPFWVRDLWLPAVKTLLQIPDET